MLTLPAFSKRGKPTNHNLINFFLYAFWQARFFFFYILIFISLCEQLFFFWLNSLCEQLWFIFFEFNNLREREREKKWGTKLVNVRKQNADTGLAYFGFGDCHGQWWTHGCFIIHVRDFQETSSTLLFSFSFFSWHSETINLHSTVRKSKCARKSTIIPCIGEIIVIFLYKSNFLGII